MPRRSLDRLAVVGGSVAGLATAFLAARAGCLVDLYVEPARVGGSFAGIAASGRRLDLGCRLFELEYEAGPAMPFDPEHGTHRPLIQDIAAFIRGILGDDLCTAAEPEIWINATRTRCPLMTVNPADLPAALPASDRAVIQDQLTHARHAEPGADLRAASVAQHGARLHEWLVEPLCAKQTLTWSDTLAVYRRKLWMALFHPQTLRQAFNHQPMSFRPHRPFATTRTGTAHSFVDRLYQAVCAQPGLTCIPIAAPIHLANGTDGAVILHFGSGLSVALPSAVTVLALPPEQLFRAAGIDYAPDRLSAGLLWVDVPEADLLIPPSSLMLCDTALVPFRIASVGRAPDGFHTLAVEFGAAAPCLHATAAALHATGTVRPGGTVRHVHHVTASAQLAATAANQRCFDQALARFEALGLGCAVLGSARRFGWDSLNDQLADAIHFGASRL